jgi:hypothetical protein
MARKQDDELRETKRKETKHKKQGSDENEECETYLGCR